MAREEEEGSAPRDYFAPALRHFVTELLGSQDGDMFVEALQNNNIKNIDNLVFPGAIFTQDTLTPPQATRAWSATIIANHLVQKVHWAIMYVDEEWNDNQRLVDDQEWLDMTKTEFKMLMAKYGTKTKNVPPTPNTPPVTTTSTSSSYTPATMFKRGIKRDPSAFPILKQQKYYQSWKRNFVGQAHAQDVAHVLDSNYNPTAQEEIDLFKLQKDYIYATFQLVLLTDKGKEIVRDHAADRDAQKVYEELETYANSSTEASIEVQKLTTMLTTAKLNHDWKGTFSGFVTYWKQQLQNYEDMTESTAHYPSEAKKRMLMAALEPVKELQELQLADEKHQVLNPGSTGITFDQYLALLDSATSRLDDLQFKNNRYSTKRQITNKTHDVQYQLHEHGSSYFDDGDLFWGDPESSVQELDIYRAQQTSGTKQQKPWVPQEVWAEINKNPELLHLWRTCDWNRAPGNQKLPARPAGKPIKANMHEQLFDDVHEPDPPTVPEHEPSTDMIDSSTSPYLAFLHQRDQLPSSDLRNIVNQSHKPKSRGAPPSSTNSSTKPSSKPTPTPRSVNMVELDGKYYVEFAGNNVHINTHNVQLNVSLGNLTRAIASLMDRGANGGLAGADCRLLEQCTPMRYADVTGAGDKKIHQLPLGNYAGLAHSNKGPVILIMHQYAGFHQGKTIHSAGQWEHFGNTIDDRSQKVGGKQRTVTLDGYVLPIQIRNGLPCLDMKPPTDEEMEQHPHVIVTADEEWDPTVLDCEQQVLNLADDDVPAHPYGANYPFNAQGDYKLRQVHNVDIGDGMYVEMDFEHYVDQCVFAVQHGESTDPSPAPNTDPPSPLAIEEEADPMLTT